MTEGTMELKTADASLLSLIILIVIYVSLYRRFDKAILSNRLFSYLVLTNISLIIIDLLSWAYNGIPGETFRVLNIAANSASFIGTSAAPSLWLIYVFNQVHQEQKRIRHAVIVLTVVFALNAIATIASIFTGWFFSVDSLNIYHRGDFFLISAFYDYTIVVYAFLFIILNKKKIEKRNYYPMLFFFVPAAIGALIQLFYYQASLNWVGMAISLFIIYLFIQNRGLNTDYLTGAFNRRQFESYISMKEKQGAEPFSAIMLDFDGLKEVNDNFGHAAGDDVLSSAVRIIKKCIKRNDFIARVGGDEFAVIMDTRSPEVLLYVNARIMNAIKKHNSVSGKPYIISFSAGWGTYDPKSGETPREFFASLDKKMYKNKAAKNAGRLETLNPA